MKNTFAVDVSPFRFAGDRRGILLVHGFVGTPFEMRPLGESLAKRGFTVAGPALAGHGPRASDLLDTGFPEWMASVERAFDELRASCDVVGVCGQSLGGLLTLELARRRGRQVAAITTLAAALWIRPWLVSGIRRTGRSRLLRRFSIPKPFGSDIADREMRRLNPTRGMPIRSLNRLVDGMEHVQAHIDEIDRPALVVHGRNDHTVPFACADAIAARLRGPVERLTLERSFHVISLDADREQLFRRIGEYFERQLALPTAAGATV